MDVAVYMLAFEEGSVREVSLPDNEVAAIASKGRSLNDLLELVFLFGQNDMQRSSHCSVSVGDVVHLDDRYHLCCPSGWHELDAATFERYSAQDRAERLAFVWRA